MEETKQIKSKAKQKFDFTIYNCFFVFALIIGAAIAIVQTIILYKYYDSAVHLFTIGSEKLTTIFYLFVFIIVLSFFSIFIVARKNAKTLPSLPKMTNPLLFISAMCGFMVIASAALSIIYPTQAASQSAKLAETFSLLIKICSIPSALYFFSLIFNVKNSYAVKITLGFFPILWCILELMCIYFDQSTPINNPLRILSQVVMIAIMAYFLLEQRFRIGRSSVQAYFTFSCIAVFLIIITAVPEIILTFSGKWQASTETAVLLSEICFGLYISARVLSFKNAPMPKRAPLQTKPASDKAYSENGDDAILSDQGEKQVSGSDVAITDSETAEYGDSNDQNGNSDEN